MWVHYSGSGKTAMPPVFDRKWQDRGAILHKGWWDPQTRSALQSLVRTVWSTGSALWETEGIHSAWLTTGSEERAGGRGTWRRWPCGSGFRRRSSSCCRRGCIHKPGGLDRSGWRFAACRSPVGPAPGPSRSGSDEAWSRNAALGGPPRSSGQTGPSQQKKRALKESGRANPNGNRDVAGTPGDYLIVFAGVSEEVSQEVESGTFADQDEVSGAVGQVSGRWEAFGTTGTRAAHAGRIYSQELPSDGPPLRVALWKQYTRVIINTNSTQLC